MTSYNRLEWVWLWRESRPFAWYQAASVGCLIVASAIGLGQPLVMKWLIDDVLPNERWGALLIASVIFLLAAVARSSFSSLASLFTALAVTRITFRIRTRCVARVLSFSPEFHARYTMGDLLQRIERDVAIIGELGSEVFPSIVRVAAEVIMAVAIMVYLDWRLSAIVLGLLPMFGYVRHRCRRMLKGCAEAVRDAHARQSSLLQEMLSGILQVQLLGAERRIARQYARLGLRTAYREITQRRNELIFTFVSMSIIGLGIASIVGYGGTRVMLGGLSVGGLVAFYGYISTILAPMGSAVGLYAQLIRVGVSLRRLIEIEQATDAIRDTPSAVALGPSPGVLVCTDVTLDYGPDKPALRGVGFHARAGERVAIVGVSGSGKSSLLKLIPRLHEVRQGSVQLDGYDVRSLRLSSLRSAVSFVPQEPVLFQGTIRENLRYACPTATAEDIGEASWTACLTDVIGRLRLGWDTPLGRLGAGLSGGERQRIAIARALLQRRPILILDEATSALDNATEHELLTRLGTWCADRIVIVVSHRLAAARWADRVLVLHQGAVVEEGCHEELSRTGTHYGALWHEGEPSAAH